jgi:citrate lyase subunit beta/citryl-CoA lyase
MHSRAPGARYLALLRQLAAHKLAAVVLPKAESPAVVERIVRTTPAAVVPLVESAAGLHALELLAQARGVARIAFGHLDFQADTGLHCGADERELDSVRLAIVLASRRANLPAPVDGITAALDDAPRLADDVARARRLGFGAKLCIHPKQVAAVNEGLGPTPAQRAWAARVLAASQVQPTGAFQLDGQMVDAPVLLRARSFLTAA